MSDERESIVLEDILPGGIKPTDHWHIKTNDGTCSRCQSKIDEDEVPLMLWRGQKGDDMLIYCNACLHAKELPDGDEPRAQSAATLAPSTRNRG